MRKVNKVLYILGAASVLLMLAGVALLLCAGFMVESGAEFSQSEKLYGRNPPCGFFRDFSAAIKTAVIGALMCVPCAVMQAVIR